MLIPSKFNGYRRDGTRNLYIGGGVGEAALLETILAGAETGAMIGGGSALLTGQDPLEGALRGGLMGGASGGIFGGGMPTGTEAMAPAGADAFAAQTSTGLNVIPGEAGTQALTPSISSGTSFNPFTAQTSTGLSTLPGEAGFGGTGGSGMFGKAGQWWDTLTPKQKMLTGGAGVLGLGMLSDRNKYGIPKQTPYTGPLSRFNFNPDVYRATTPYAEGGITTLNQGGNMIVGGNPMDYTDAMARTNLQDASSPVQYMESGGIANLGGYSDGGRMLKGPGDGMSDSIPATIAGKRPARLATDEFVVPADVVSHLGNGSSDAGAKQLYAMMDKVRKARTGNQSQGREINPRKYMPA